MRQLAAVARGIWGWSGAGCCACVDSKRVDRCKFDFLLIVRGDQLGTWRQCGAAGFRGLQHRPAAERRSVLVLDNTASQLPQSVVPQQCLLVQRMYIPAAAPAKRWCACGRALV
jgi:hypothetical protein